MLREEGGHRACAYSVLVGGTAFAGGDRYIVVRRLVGGVGSCVIVGRPAFGPVGLAAVEAGW